MTRTIRCRQAPHILSCIVTLFFFLLESVGMFYWDHQPHHLQCSIVWIAKYRRQLKATALALSPRLCPLINAVAAHRPFESDHVTVAIISLLRWTFGEFQYGSRGRCKLHHYAAAPFTCVSQSITIADSKLLPIVSVQFHGAFVILQSSHRIL